MSREAVLCQLSTRDLTAKHCATDLERRHRSVCLHRDQQHTYMISATLIPHSKNIGSCTVIATSLSCVADRQTTHEKNNIELDDTEDPKEESRSGVVSHLRLTSTGRVAPRWDARPSKSLANVSHLSATLTVAEHQNIDRLW
jgi:hypothetical protein